MPREIAIARAPSACDAFFIRRKKLKIESKRSGAAMRIAATIVPQRK